MSKIKPTGAELEILNLLWDNGPSSVREIHKQLSEKREVFYTTTLKTMQVMHSKGFVDRDTSQRAHIYSPSVARDNIQKNLLGGLRDILYGGALGPGKPTRQTAARMVARHRFSGRHVACLLRVMSLPCRP